MLSLPRSQGGSDFPDGMSEQRQKIEWYSTHLDPITAHRDSHQEPLTTMKILEKEVEHFPILPQEKPLGPSITAAS